MDFSPQAPAFRVAALYRFCRLEQYEGLRAPLATFCCSRGIKGTLILAREGINGTVAGSDEAIAALVSELSRVPELAGLDVKYSSAQSMPFRRMKVQLRREIVSMGVAGIDPLESAGTYVEPRDWNALISRDDVVVVDTRNDYEVRIGSFEGAVDPGTGSFSEFPAWLVRNRDALAGKTVAMFCTGGIRCEKATAFARSFGISEVYHLKGGILSYLENVPAAESLWHGECFVFDERVSVSHGLVEGGAQLCRACRAPVTPVGRNSPRFCPGVSCDACFDQRTEADRARYAERQRQMQLAAEGGLASRSAVLTAPAVVE